MNVIIVSGSKETSDRSKMQGCDLESNECLKTGPSLHFFSVAKYLSLFITLFICMHQVILPLQKFMELQYILPVKVWTH